MGYRSAGSMSRLDSVEAVGVAFFISGSRWHLESIAPLNASLQIGHVVRDDYVSICVG